MPSAAANSRPPAPLSEGDYRHLADFRAELREFLHFSDEAAHAAGIHPQQHQALLVIRGSRTPDSVTVGELATRLKIKPHTAAELVHRMEAEDLVAKTADPSDGRRVLLRLTRRSERLLSKLSETHKAELARVGPVLRDVLTHLQILS